MAFNTGAARPSQAAQAGCAPSALGAARLWKRWRHMPRPPRSRPAAQRRWFHTQLQTLCSAAPATGSTGLGSSRRRGAPDEGRGGAQAGGVVKAGGEGQEGLRGLQVAEALPVKVAAHEQRPRDGDRADARKGAARLALMPGAGAAAGARWLLAPTSPSSAAAGAAAQAAAAQGWPASRASRASPLLQVRAGPWRRAHGAKERPSTLSAARSALRQRPCSSLAGPPCSGGVCQTELLRACSRTHTPEAGSDMQEGRFSSVESRFCKKQVLEGQAC